MSKSKNDNKNEKQPNKEDNNLNTKIIHYTSEIINLQGNTMYNPFIPAQQNFSENKNDNIKTINLQKNIDSDSKSKIIEDENINEKKIQEIIDINTSSNQSEYGNNDEEWNSSNERNKEKLKKDLLENNNQSKNDDWESEEMLKSNTNQINADKWESNKSGEWGSNSNDKDNNVNNKENHINILVSNNTNSNEQKKNNESNKMEIDDDIREDNEPLPDPKQTEDIFANYNSEINKKDNDLTWFNRDGRNPKDEYYENNIKKIMVEHEKQIKRREDKISELESIEFRMYYVRVNSKEEPKLLHDQIRPRIRFQNLNKVPEQLKNNISQLKFDYLTPIQRAIMPYIQIGKDIVCIAETGSGKTLSYLFPIIGQMLIEGVPKNPYISKEKNEENEKNKDEENMENKDKKFRDNIAYPLCLIMAPSRELVLQISKESKKLSMDTGIKTVSLIGGEKRNFQNIELSKGCDIIVSTPLRLYDFLKNGKINLQMIKYLILDEAEKMLEPDFYEQLKNIFDKLPKRKFRQNLLFSATFNDDVKGIAKYCLNNYYYFCPLIESPKQIKHEFFHPNNGEEKKQLLLDYLKKEENKNKSILIFMNSKKDVESLNKILEKENIKSCIIHGGKTQNDRNKSIREFSLGYKNILISTDIISRGLDFPNVYCVINYDMPNNIDDYIHRIGRTGRLGQNGVAITYIDSIDDTNKEKLKELLNSLGKEIPSWIEDIQFKRFYNFPENNFCEGKRNNNWNNDEDNTNRNTLKKWNKWNRDNNNEWGKLDKNNGKNWRDEKREDWGNNIKENKWNNNKNDDWGNSGNNNEDEWGNNENERRKNNNFKNYRFEKNEDNGWNENNDWKNNDDNKYKKDENGRRHNNDRWRKNINKDDWGNNDNNFENKNDLGNIGNNNEDEWGNNSNNNQNNNKYNDGFKGMFGNRGRDRNEKRKNNNISFYQNDDIEIPEDAYEELFVMGINYNSTEDDLKETFSKYGEIKSCKILMNKENKSSRGIGFVKFSEKKGAVKAMNDAENIVCGGRNLRIRYSNKKDGEIKGKKGFRKRENENNDNNNNNDWEKNGNNINEIKEFEKKGREGKGRGRGRDRGRDRGRGRGGRDEGMRNNDYSWNNKKENSNDDWGDQKSNNDDWGNNNNNDDWGNDKTENKKEENNSWEKRNNRERSRDKDNKKDPDEW